MHVIKNEYGFLIAAGLESRVMLRQFGALNNTEMQCCTRQTVLVANNSLFLCVKMMEWWNAQNTETVVITAASPQETWTCSTPEHGGFHVLQVSAWALREQAFFHSAKTWTEGDLTLQQAPPWNRFTTKHSDRLFANMAVRFMDVQNQYWLCMLYKGIPAISLFWTWRKRTGVVSHSHWEIRAFALIVISAFKSLCWQMMYWQCLGHSEAPCCVLQKFLNVAWNLRFPAEYLLLVRLNIP